MISSYPQQINDTCWYYEDKKGIILVHEIRINGVYERTDQIKIPRYKLIKSLKRMEKHYGK